MNFMEQSTLHGLPQFSELSSRSNSIVPSSMYSINTSQIVPPSSSVYTQATASDQGKQTLLTNGSTKYTNSLIWPNLQALNIPNYSQNNLITVQSSNLPVRILQNTYIPASSSSSQEEIASIIKQENDDTPINSEINDNQNEESSVNNLQQQQQSSTSMTEYLQKLQATTLPSTLHQLMKLHSEQKRDNKIMEDDNSIIKQPELSQNSILNIPSVAGFRNSNINSNHYLNEQLINDINPSDLNIHMESSDDSIASSQIKIETQQMQNELPKTEKKQRNFKAKPGEIKIAFGLDGSMLYCCPECNLAFTDKTEIDAHIQMHVKERKYQCKECGAMLKRKEHLDQHMRGHSDERPFKCSVCNKAFKRNEHLTRHFVIHSGDKNFSCNICHKAFSRKDHLNKHTQTHLGIKKQKVKKDTVQSDIKDNNTEIIVNDIPKHELSYILKDGNFAKQDTTFLQHLQSLQKDQSIMNTYTVFKEQMMKDGIHQQHAVNMNEILPQNTRYLMPS